MRIRSDSPFFGITEQQKEGLLGELDKGFHLDKIAEWWEGQSGIQTTPNQVQRFVTRLRYEQVLRSTDDSVEELGVFAERGVDGKARDGLIEAARQRLLEEALSNGDNALLLELYRAA